MKTILTFIIPAVIVLTSCKGNLFLQRKYTAGRFVEHKKQIVAPTPIKIVRNVDVASKNAMTEEIKQELLVENAAIKEEHIIKKDSVFIKRLRGRDVVKIKPCKGPNIQITEKTIDYGLVISEIKRLPDDDGKDSRLYGKLKRNSENASVFCWVPVAGIILAFSALRYCKKFSKIYSAEDIKVEIIISRISAVLSILFILLLVIALLSLVAANPIIIM